MAPIKIIGIILASLIVGMACGMYFPGRTGPIGLMGPQGVQGLQGLASTAVGPSGPSGPPGQSVTGLAGPAGVGIVNALVNSAGHLVVTLSNGQAIDVGSIMGPVGPQGIQGIQGNTGTAGTSGYNVFSTSTLRTGTYIIPKGSLFTLYGSGFPDDVEVRVIDAVSAWVSFGIIATVSSFGNFYVNLTMPTALSVGIGSIVAYVNGQQVTSTPVVIQ